MTIDELLNLVTRKMYFVVEWEQNAMFTDAEVSELSSDLTLIPA